MYMTLVINNLKEAVRVLPAIFCNNFQILIKKVCCYAAGLIG